VVTLPAQGEVWWAEAEDKRRPVLVCTRSEAIPVLSVVVVAPVTRTVRGIPTEVALGDDEGLAVSCAASFDNLQTVPRSALTSRLGVLDPTRQRELCDALRAMSDC
jgi:mRNA interferase MazF